MSNLNAGPMASSTAVKPQNQRTVKNNSNDTFSSMFSEELNEIDLVRKTFSEMSSSKNNPKNDSMYSSISGQSSLGILELDNMSDIGSSYKRETFPLRVHNNQRDLTHRLSQANQARNTLARASSIKSILPTKNCMNEKNTRTSLINMSNTFENMLKEGMNDSVNSFSSEDFISGSEFKENLAEIEEVNRKEFGSLSESRFNFTLDGEKQSIENGSFAAKYFAAKSESIENLFASFPKRPNNNETYSKAFEDNPCSLLNHSDIRKKQEEQTPIGANTMASITSWTDSHVSNDIRMKQKEQTYIGSKTMSSITSWTDSHVSNNMLNSTSLSDISEVLTSKTNSTDPKELTKALLSGDLSVDKQLHESNKYLQRRFSTSTRFSIASQNLEHDDISFPSLKNCSFDSSQKNNSNVNEKLNKTMDFKVFEENKKREKFINNPKTLICTPSKVSTKNINSLSNNFDKKQTMKYLINKCHFILTPKSGYFEDCSSETKILENNIDLSNYSILSNNHDDFIEMSLNKSANVSKIVYCNETLSQDKLNQSNIQNHENVGEVLEIGDICIGTYSQAVITLENCLTVNASYTLSLLKVSLNDNKNYTSIDNKPNGTKAATVLCSNKMHIIPALSEASFTIGIIPLVSGIINVHVKLESNDVSQEICRNIQIHSFEPQITWINNTFGSMDFGFLPELSQKSLPIKLLNKGTYQVPIKFILNQDHCEDVIQARAIINPSELWQCDVNIITPNILKNNTKKNLINGRLRIVLDSVEELSANYSPLLYCSNLLGHVGLTDISFDQNPLTLKKSGQSMNGVLEITNKSELPINLCAHQNNKQSSEFTIQPDKFKLAVNEKIKLKIIYFPSKLFNYPKETSICIQVVSSQKQFFLKVNCTNDPNTEYQPIRSPSRSISPWSTSSSSAVGQLELESTCSSLVWGSVPSNNKSLQTFTLRNRGSHKEKLFLSIKDNKNCFKLISFGESQVSDMKLLLEPMESQKLSVALISTSNEGEAYGQIVIRRQHGDEKRVISLFGYCGHSVITIHGTFEDTFGNMWLYPEPQMMTAQFSVTNSGNATAFIHILKENSSEDIIQPNQFLLKKGETVYVEVTLIMCPERLEMLLEQDSNTKIINVNKLSIIYGDEVSRVRVSRLWSRMKNEKKAVYLDNKRIDEISNMFNGMNIVNVDHLADNEKSLFKLWKTGISEKSIVILMERNNLESLLCDTTTVFSELETTVISRLPQSPPSKE